jgi:hypothetical protein
LETSRHLNRRSKKNKKNYATVWSLKKRARKTTQTKQTSRLSNDACSENVSFLKYSRFSSTAIFFRSHTQKKKGIELVFQCPQVCTFVADCSGKRPTPSSSLTARSTTCLRRNRRRPRKTFGNRTTGASRAFADHIIVCCTAANGDGESAFTGMSDIRLEGVQGGRRGSFSMGRAMAQMLDENCKAYHTIHSQTMPSWLFRRSQVSRKRLPRRCRRRRCLVVNLVVVFDD